MGEPEWRAASAAARAYADRYFARHFDEAVQANRAFLLSAIGIEASLELPASRGR
jgi:hypothetical protein